MRRLAVAGIASLWLSAGWTPAPAVPARAAAATVAVAAEHRAAVIVDTGTSVKSVCVRFREDAISGADALARARVEPVFHGFSGKGAAVCALCGVGCPAGDSCLTCDPEGRFWSYSRAPAGTGALRASGVGASSTTVRDGDVEGWRWGLGGSPPFATVEAVCGEAAPASSPASGTPPPVPAPAVAPAGAPSTVAAAPAPEPVRTTGAGPAAGPAPGPGPARTAGPPAPPVPGDAPAGPPGPGPGARSPTTAAGLAAAPTAGGGGGAGLGVFAAIMSGLVGWAGWTRRSRRRRAPTR